MKTLKVEKWLENFGDDELLELGNRSIVDQLKFYDNNGTGIGFVLFLVPTVADTGEEVDPGEMKVELHVQSQPVIKLRNSWYTVDDDNLSDVLGAIIRMLRPEA